MGLDSVQDELAQNLPYGSQRILGVCVALATNPSLLLLDEPVAGMNPVETQVMAELIRQMRDRHITIALVDHNMKAIMSLCDRIEGPPEEIRNSQVVIEAYLGKEKKSATGV